MWTKVVLGLSFLAMLPVTGDARAANRPPTLVSPGSTLGSAQIRDECPTFLWGALESRTILELVVYELPRRDEIASEDEGMTVPLLRLELPGSAPGWTPSLDRCLKTGQRYAWTLRATTEGEVSPWARPHLFEVMPSPSVAEVEGALETIRLYLADNDTGGEEAEHAEIGRLQSESDRPRSPEPARSVAPRDGRAPEGTGSAAIRGSQPDPSGETYGVEGVSQSPDGAGLAAQNSGGGADLVLAGDGASPPAGLTESSLDRSSGDAQTFDFVNSGGGSMTLQVEGAEVVTSLTDQDTLGGLSCAGTQIAKWDGAAWQCEADENDDTLGGLGCDPNQVAQWNGAAWVCSNAGTDTLGGLSCAAGQVVHWNGAAWVCGQPALTEVTCNGSSSCSAFCPGGSIVWTGGCSAFPGSATIIESAPTSTGAGQPPTGWTCDAFNPLGSATVDVTLYCVSQ